MEVEEIIEKILNHLENKMKLDKRDCFIVARKLQEVCWDNLNDEDYEEDIEEDIPDELPELAEELNKEVPKKPIIHQKEENINDGDF